MHYSCSDHSIKCAFHQTTREQIHTHTCVLLFLLMCASHSGCSNVQIFLCVCSCTYRRTTTKTSNILWSQQCVGVCCVISSSYSLLCIGISARFFSV
jgi:hypothetical protein